MKIAHLISSGGLFGAEKVMLGLAAALKQEGHRLWIVAVENRHNPRLEVIEEARRLGLETHVVASQGRFDFNAAGKLADFIRLNEIEVLHSHNYKANLLAFLASRKVRTRLVTTLHGYIGDGLRLKIYEALDRWLVRFFDKVVLVDASLEKWFGGRDSRFVVINNGIDTQEFKPSARDTVKEEFVIGTVGRLSAEKGYGYLIEAFGRVLDDGRGTMDDGRRGKEEGRGKREEGTRDEGRRTRDEGTRDEGRRTRDEGRGTKGRGVKLLIVGDGELRESLKLKVKSLKLEDKVVFAGFQSDVKPFYEKMDVFVSSSLLEHFPVAVLEAMACGKAIIATDVGGTKDLIKNRQTGFLINKASVNELRAGLIELISDAVLRKTLGENARAFVEQKYSFSRVVDSYLKVYKALL